MSTSGEPMLERSPQNKFISPSQFRGYPKAQSRKQGTKGRKKGKSMISTDIPEKDKLEINQNSKKKPIATKTYINICLIRFQLYFQLQVDNFF